MNSRTNPSGGFLLVAAGAALWGTDAIFRRGLALDLAAPVLVFLEHAVLVAMTLPILWLKRAQLRNLGRIDWIAALVIGAGSSAVATILFTSAFRYGDPTTPLLLQKLQPLVAVLGARLLLGERLLPRFAWFLLAGLAGAYLVAFPDPAGVSVSALTPALLAVGAASLWGLGTVLGRRLAPKIPFSLLTALRFAIGLPAAGLIVAVMGETAAVGAVSGTDIRDVVALAFVPGLIALLLYYNGLRSTPAAAATIAELAFPHRHRAQLRGVRHGPHRLTVDRRHLACRDHHHHELAVPHRGPRGLGRADGSPGRSLISRLVPVADCA